jgi:hypothetical protein
MTQSSQTIKLIRIRLFVLTVVTFTALAIDTNAQTAVIVTPSYFAANPVDIQTGGVDKIAKLIQNGETRVLMQVTEELARTGDGDGASYVRYQSITHAGGSGSVDTVRFDVNLTPHSRSTVSAGDTLTIEFAPGEVMGKRRTKNGVQDLSATFVGSVFDSNVVAYLCAALAQSEPGRYTAPLYSDQTDSVEWYTILVDSASTVKFSDLPERAVKVVYSSPDGRSAIVWVKEGEARILREEANPAPGVEVLFEWNHR